MADTTNTPTLPKQAGKELGKSGTLILNGFITAEEYNTSLIGKAALKVYETMRRSDATVHSALQVVKLPILATTWDLEPAADIEGNVEDADKEVAAFVKRELMERKINWHDFMRQALTMLDFGHSVFEKVYELTDFNGQPRIGLAKLASRKQTTILNWSISGDQPGVTQQTLVGQTIEIPREKLVVFTNDKEGENYQGISILRYAYKDWDIKDKLTLVNAISLEKLGVGVPTVQAKDNETPSDDDFRQAEIVLSNMRANQSSYLKIPSTLIVEMLDLKANSTKEIIPTLQFHNRAIFASIMATFMDLGGSSGSGAKALSGDLTSLFMKSEEAVANVLLGTIMEDVVQQLCDLNFSKLTNGYPKLKFGTIADDDTVAIATSVNQLMTAGALTYDPELEDHLRNIYRFPELPEDLKEAKQNEISNPTTPTTPSSNVSKEDTKNLDPKTQAALRSAKQAKKQLLDTLLR